jgi:hypothetical protein
MARRSKTGRGILSTGNWRAGRTIKYVNCERDNVEMGWEGSTMKCELLYCSLKHRTQIQWTLELRTVWCSNNLKLEQNIWGKSGFETRTKTRKSNKESDERRVIHLPVNSNIPPTIIIDWLLYNIFMHVLL